MKCRKCLTTLASALIIAAATLTWAGGAASSQLDGEPDRPGAYNILHLFTWAKNPSGNLIFDAAGNLYGTTGGGGSAQCAGGCGTVWKLARNPKGTWTVSILHAFTGADGSEPTGGVIFDVAGNLYGTTEFGGSTACVLGCGVVFKLAPNPDGTWTESVLYTFTGGADGGFPEAGLIFDATGNLYGTTEFGGSTACVLGCGVVFKLALNPDETWTERVLYSFTGGADGALPFAGLIFDATGNLYGTTVGGGAADYGVAFKLAPNPDWTWTESVLHSFTGDGGSPYAGQLIFDAADNLYGTTSGIGAATCGGVGGCGTVFKLARNQDGTWTESLLHSFTGADGNIPLGGLIFDSAGNLYGTTNAGGDTACNPDGLPHGFGCGVVFKLESTPSGWSERVLHTFIGFGSNPSAPVIFDSRGNLYGTTTTGNHNSGVVFEITP